jgi:hypothetical protein
VWEEDGKYPDLIIELLSTSTASVDRTLKRDLYVQRFHTPEYFYFSPETLELAGFRLEVNRYQPIVPNEQGWFWSDVLGLFLGQHDQQLRYFTLEGILLPTPQEAVRIEVEKGLLMFQRERLKVEQAQQQAEQERLIAEQAQQQAEQAKTELHRLQEKLRSLGISPD